MDKHSLLGQQIRLKIKAALAKKRNQTYLILFFRQIKEAFPKIVIPCYR